MANLLDRVARVRLLLETLNDPYPTPKGALRSDSGPAASRYVPCETCRRSGRVRNRSTLVLCLSCDGAGWRRRQAGDVLWDAYVGLPVEQAVELPAMPVAPPRHEHDVEEEAYGWERARASHDRHGSYKEVRIRLDQLGREHPRRHRLVRAVLVDKEPRVLSSVDDTEMTLGVAWITLRMRSIRVPPWIMERSVAAERRETIAALVADGYSAGEIARRTGMSKEAVRRKIRRLPAVHSRRAGVPA
jgi:DNA-binding transcriptional ArsR family regulator